METPWRIERLGTEALPLLIWDDFHPDPNSLIEEAAQQRFARIHPYYPGVRAGCHEAYFHGIARALETPLQEAFGYRHGAVAEGGCFSLVTLKPSQLAPIQRLPHFDGPDPTKLAVLHYLHGAEQGGTGFFRHRATGFESVNAQRLPTYQQALQADVRAQGLPPDAYVTGSTPLFELIGHIEAAPNRLVAYFSHSLHSGMISPQCPLSDDPRTGRLTLNTFLAPA